MSSTSTRRTAYSAWVAVCLLWGTTYLGIRIALETVPPMLMGALRWTVAGALILAALALRGERLPGVRQWPALGVLGVLMIGFGNGGVVWAEQTVPSGLTAVLVATIPFWMVGLEAVTGTGERITTRTVVGLAIGFAGILLLVWPEVQFGGGRAFLAGVAATQFACVGWAIGSSYSRRLPSGNNVIAAAALQMLFGGIVMLLAGTLHGEWRSLGFNTRTTVAMGYLVVFGSIAGFSAYAYALKHLPVSTVSLYAYVNPVIAVVLGTVLLGEPLSPRLAAAGATVLAGIALVRRT
jgi:drug/metabolite transporter (DMT)-like permease